MNFETRTTLKRYLENRNLDVNEFIKWIKDILIKRVGE